MHKSVLNLVNIQNEIKLNFKRVPNIIAVSKTFSSNQILPLLDHGHINFGENKVQEALDKWVDLKSKYKNIKLHMIGKLQTNKVKNAISLFDYIHSIDNKKLAEKIANEQQKQNKSIKFFIQVNIGDEEQKSGISKKRFKEFLSFCKNLKLNIVGLMCIPPINLNSDNYFHEMKILNKELNLQELSMGMSSDYLNATRNSSTYLRIGSKIFGNRV